MLPNIVLTGNCLFVKNRNDIDIKKLNMQTGDIVIYCIGNNFKKSDEFSCGQIRGLVYNGKKLCNVFLWTFSMHVGFNSYKSFQEIVNLAIKKISLNNKKELIYQNMYGYFLKTSTWL